MKREDMQLIMPYPLAALQKVIDKNQKKYAFLFFATKCI